MMRCDSLISGFAALVLSISMPVAAHAFAECFPDSVEAPAEPAAIQEAPVHAPIYDGIVSLRLRIDDSGKITVLDKSVVAGRWQDNRIIPVGQRLYYEVIDDYGAVIARGFRRDPRNMHAGRFENFILTAPYKDNAACVNIYLMGYENGGSGGYSRDFALLASVDVRRQMTASVQ
jgi:hypothetical protein